MLKMLWLILGGIATISLVFFSANQFSEAEVDSSITQQGIFAMLDSMLSDGRHQAPSYFLLTEDDGVHNMYKLTFSVPIENPQSLSGKKVIVQGHLSLPERSLSVSEQQIESIDVHTVHEIPSGGMKLESSMVSSMSIIGTENIQTLLVKYPDITNEAHSSDYFKDRFYTATDSLTNFYKTSSYNQFSITGTADDWKTLPSGKSTYQLGGSIAWPKIVKDAIQAHKGTVNFSNVDGIIIVTNDCADSLCAAYGYLGKFNWDGGTGVGIKNIRVSLLPDVNDYWCCGQLSSRGLFVAAHELGHNLTFDHTPAPPGVWSVGVTGAYNDPWSALSAGYDGESPTGLIMGQRDSIGWVGTANKVTIPRGTSNTITLDTINEVQSGSNPQMAFVPLPDGTKYILEARKDGLFDDTPLDNEGIIIYKFFPNGNQYPYLTFYPPDKNAKYSLVATSGTNSEFDFVSANLDVHESWTDSNQVLVHTISKTSTSVTVFVSNAGPLPPPTVPYAPISLTSFRFIPSEAKLSWTVPYDGGSAITDYIIEYKLSADISFTTFADDTSTDTFATITGLTNDESYDFKVSAVNSLGSSSPAHLPPIVSDAPISLMTTPINHQVLLSWTAPADDGGSTITDYIIEFKLSSDASYTVYVDDTIGSTKATVTGLTNDESYDFKVSAINGIGTGPASNVASATPSISAPSAPTSLSATAISTSDINLIWTAPADDGGAPITGYMIHRDNVMIVDDTASTGTTYSDIGLDPETEYTYVVMTINSIGTSIPSNEASVTTNAETDSFLLSASGPATLKSAVKKGTNLFDKGPYAISVKITADIDSVSAGVPKLSHIAGTFTIDGKNVAQDVIDHSFTNLKLVISKDHKSIKWIAKEGSGQFNFPSKVDFKNKIDKTGKKNTIAKIVLSKATFTPNVSTSNIDFN
jgi:M6 family metalloprotease-like protein